MSVHFDRAMLLYQQSRYELAEKELQQELANHPDNAFAHALLALCLLPRKDYQRATQEAKQAIHEAPDMGFGHFALATVLQERNRPDEAEPVVLEAIRLEPDQASYFSLRAAIRLVRRQWAKALEAADEGLAIDPEHVGCSNLRAQALVKLGRQEHAGTTIQAALERDPENALTHANQGWALLERCDYTRAMEHFREALRLDPELDWARQGIVEALKARHFIYRWMLAYFLWVAKLSNQAQWALFIGGYVGFRIARGIAGDNPEIAPFIWPLLAVYVAFVLLTWLASPIFDLLLRLNRFGRLALSRDQIVASNWIAGLLLLGLCAAVAAIILNNFGLFIIALMIGLLMLPTSAIWKCSPGWPRTAMVAVTIGLSLLGVAALTVQGTPNLISAYFLGILGSQFLANYLASVEPRH